MIDVAPRTSDEMVDELALGRVVAGRSCRNFAGLPDHHIRFSVGEDWQNERFLQVINSL